MGTCGLVVHSLIFFLLFLANPLFSSVTGLSVLEKPLLEATYNKEMDHKREHLLSTFSHRLILESKSSKVVRDVTNPITTVPLINPMTPGSTTNPVVTPLATPTAPTLTSPTTMPLTPSSSGGSWCVASQSASQTALQVALDYACGYGGADCSGIQSGGGCYNPNTLRDHASYAFNRYYQKYPSPTSCNFGGTALITNVDPSSGSCQYPSTSTSSSVLNTTNPTGAAVFGSGPSGPSNSDASVSHDLPILLTSTCLSLVLLAMNL